jgi:hypothetical protein
MTTTKNQPTHGGKRKGAGVKPGTPSPRKGPIRKTVSARLSLDAHERLRQRAAVAGRSLTAQAEIELSLGVEPSSPPRCARCHELVALLESGVCEPCAREEGSL